MGAYVVFLKNCLNKLNYIFEKIPVVTEYCCQIVVINNSGSIAPQIDLIKHRFNYLWANMRYYTKDVSFENQYLLLTIYVRPYFLYTAPIIETQTKTLQKSFHVLYRNSFKQFMELPSNLPSVTLESIFYFKNQIWRIVNAKTRRKVSTRFVVPLD
jgi:hypothetical protein